MLMMLPFEAPTIFEGIHKSYFRMPRVVKDQRQKFENDDLFRQLAHESAVKYTGFKDRPLEERQMKFMANCQEGHTEVSVVQSGNQFTLMFNPTANPAYNNEGCDFDKDSGKVHIKSGFILNGVCVLWRGWIDWQRLEGFGCLEFDEYRAYLEEAMAKQQSGGDHCGTAAGAMQANSNQHNGRNGNHAGRLGSAGSPTGAGGPPHDPSVLANGVSAPAGPNLQLGAPPVGAGPLGLSPASCMAAAASLVGAGGPPPVSLAEASHYGNAAIAAAAAAAFHQALVVGQPGAPPHALPPPLSLPPPPQPHTLHPHAQLAAGAGAPLGPVAQLHQQQLSQQAAYKQNGFNPQTLLGPGQPGDALGLHLGGGRGRSGSPGLASLTASKPSQQLNKHSESASALGNSPPRPPLKSAATPPAKLSSASSCSSGQATKRPASLAGPDEPPGQQLDELDVVSDSSVIGPGEQHSFAAGQAPPKRLFKSDPTQLLHNSSNSSNSAANNNNQHHHNHLHQHHTHHHHHQRARRAV